MIGVDEVGRGSWAGPLLVCAARLHKQIIGLADSKTLSAQKRAQLFEDIKQHADVGFGWVSADEIDDIGLSAALKLATAKALTEIDIIDNEEIIIDGTVSFIPGYSNVSLLPKADMKFPVVSAASIAAKVTRDARMIEYAQQYPGYGFESHVGYGTRQHAAAIGEHGVTRLHRKSFRLPLPFATLTE